MAGLEHIRHIFYSTDRRLYGIHCNLRQSILPDQSQSSLLLSRPRHKKLYTKNRSNHINSGEKEGKRKKERKISVLRDQKAQDKSIVNNKDRIIRHVHIRSSKVITPIGGRGIEKNQQVQRRYERSHQNTVPSERIMIGGSFVLGRETSAISRPPYYNRLETIYAADVLRSG